MVDVLNEILTISRDLKEGYYLKEKLLDIIYHDEVVNVEEQLDNWISNCIEKIFQNL